jgi:outer membrane protein TolC
VWTGTDLKFGHERNSGVYLSQEKITPSNGLNYAGITIPVGQGLFIDERRATLRQAQLFQKIAAAEQVKLLNKLMLSVAKDYWEWYAAYKSYTLWEEALRLAQIRYNGVRDRVIIGELAPIDTVEARIILQERMSAQQQMSLALQNARLQLSNHLWNAANEPLEAQPTLIPDDFMLTTVPDTAALAQLCTEAKANHPELQKLEFKLQQLDVQKRLSREMLKPIVNLNYNLLSANASGNTDLNYTFASNNYKFGLEIGVPLLFRKERGKLQMVRVKQSQTRLEQLQTNREIRNSIESEYNEMRNIASLLDLQQQMTNNYGRLRDAEVKKFAEGESTLFLINSRESKWIEAQLKLVSLQAKYRKAAAMLQWAAGKNEFAE